MPFNSRRLILAALIVFLAGCRQAARERSATEQGSYPARLERGCYLGSLSSGGDSILLRLETVSGEHVAGSLRSSIPGKDRRSGSFEGFRGSDGIVRAMYRFMQEGVQDSIRIQFMRDPGRGKALLLRPDAYDPGTGAGYPDSSKPFSIRLRTMACDGLGS